MHEPMKNSTEKIGIGITTRNRYAVFSTTFARITALAPKGAKIVVVDDCSDTPVPEAKFRFIRNVGIARAKNKCLQLLEDCDHIFLFDDDCYPCLQGWYLPYVNSPEPHLMYLFKDFKNRVIGDAKLVYQDDQLKALSHPRGCMLYFKQICLRTAGGMDVRYQKWGDEHGDLSNRIYNLGLTTFRFADVRGSEKLIHSEDEHEAVAGTVAFDTRKEYIALNKPLYEASFKSTEYCDYGGKLDRMPKLKGIDRDIVLCAYLNGFTDSQRKSRWSASLVSVKKLADSIMRHRRELVVLNNCFDRHEYRGAKLVRVCQGAHPYAQRWLSCWQYLRDNPGIRNVFIVDATDVEMLNDPFPRLAKGKLYVGDEQNNIGCAWMKLNAHSLPLRIFVYENRKAPLLNCGVVGGSREDVMRLCRGMYEGMLGEHSEEEVDMPVFNFIVSQWDGAVEFGRKVTTIFKRHEVKSTAWFKHK